MLNSLKLNVVLTYRLTVAAAAVAAILRLLSLSHWQHTLDALHDDAGAKELVEQSTCFAVLGTVARLHHCKKKAATG